jgi:hypothetical protein
MKRRLSEGWALKNRADVEDTLDDDADEVSKESSKAESKKRKQSMVTAERVFHSCGCFTLRRKTATSSIQRPTRNDVF